MSFVELLRDLGRRLHHTGSSSETWDQNKHLGRLLLRYAAAMEIGLDMSTVAISDDPTTADGGNLLSMEDFLRKDQKQGFVATCLKSLPGNLVCTVCYVGIIVGILLALGVNIAGVNISGGVWLWCANSGLCFVLYVCSLRRIRLKEALARRVIGMEAVLRKIDAAIKKDPTYHWKIECYHYETRGSGDQQRQEKVVTHRASRTGTIQSVDTSEKFVPDTRNVLTQMKTDLVCDFAGTNYEARFKQWVNLERRDTHQDYSKSESLGEEGLDFLAEWVEGKAPCWLNVSCFYLSALFGCVPCFRAKAKSQLKSQKVQFRKKCHDLP